MIAGAAAGGTEAAKQTILDAYEGLKIIIKKKFGGHNDLTQAIEKVKAAPASPGWQLTLEEEVNAAKLTAEALLKLLQGLPGGRETHTEGKPKTKNGNQPLTG